MHIQHKEIRMLVVDVIKELRSRKLRSMISRIPRKVRKMSYTSTDINNGRVLGSYRYESRHDIEVALDVDFESIIPFFQLGLHDRLDGWQVSGIGNKNI